MIYNHQSQSLVLFLLVFMSNKRLLHTCKTIWYEYDKKKYKSKM